MSTNRIGVDTEPLERLQMKLSDERINELQGLLKAEFGLCLTTEQAQEAGVAIMRFIVSKKRNKQLIFKENNNGNINPNSTKKTTPPNH